jgi:tol-pal system protein YbgF
MSRGLVATAVLALIATGCASPGSVRQLREEVTGLRAEMKDVRRDLADMVKQIAELDARNADAHGALVEQAAETARQGARLDGAELALREGRALPARPPRANLAPAPDEAERAYNAALATFRAREHGQAVLDFMDLIAKYPGHPLAPAAQFWIGEAYYVHRDDRHALVEFQRVIEMAPVSRAAADALLRIGLVHTNLRENSRAQQAWQRVVRDYPASEAAGKARALLREHAARRP